MVGKVREISICNMWLWIGFCLASAVISKNTILATGAWSPQVSRNANCEEVLLKTWTIFANMLGADGMTVKVPSRDHVIYALTLIKKSIQDNEDSDYDNVPLKQKLYIREAELARTKGVYLYDNRPLQTLLGQEIIPNENRNLNFEYGLNTNDNPRCREAFRKLMQSTYEGYDNLANSPFCTAPYGVLSSQYTVFNPGYPNQFVGFNDKVKNPTRNPGKDQLAIFNDAIQNPPSEANMVPSTNVLPNGQNLNPGDSNKLVHAVKLSKETNQLLGGDYMANLEYAKGVADKMNKLYQSSNSYEYSLTAHQPLRHLNSQFVSIDAGGVNKPLITTFYSKPAVVQTSYVAQSLLNTQSNTNKDHNLSVENTYMYAPVQGMQDAVVNQSYTLISNTMQSQAAADAATAAGAGIQNNFVNAKWHPNPAYSSEPSNEELLPNPPAANIKYKPQILSAPKPTFHMQNHPHGSNRVVPIPQNIEGLSDPIPTKHPTRSNVPQPFVPKNQLSYNTYPLVYPYSSNRWNYLQNNAYKLGQNQNQRYLFNYYNKYPQVSVVRPINQLQYQKRMIQVPGIQLNTQAGIKLNTQAGIQNSILMRQNYLRQNYPNMIYGQTLVQNVPQYQTYGVNVLNKPLALQYGAYNNRYVNNVPFTQQTVNYNNQPIIDKLATWISGTNSEKLNSNFDSEAEIELTYKVIKPPPVYQPAVFYVKFRMPYQQFAKRLNEFMKIQNSRSASPDTDLYNNLVSQYNATVIPPGMTEIAQEDIKSQEGKVLVRARYIQPNESESGNANSVDIINLDKQTEENNENVENPSNNEARGAEVQMQGV